ncbi:MAG: ABC transporter substrate-binding protein [Bacteroidales bacterium]|nr:ABC transporter substrate-binding protein [Bacteroidales bacterium]
MKFYPKSLVLFSFLIIFSGCFQTIEKQQDNVFRYNEASGVVSLDPAFAKDLPHIWVCNQLYNGLVALDEDMNVVPSIAKTWKIEDEGLTYTFYLRNDVLFHENEVFENGKRIVVANDFVYSFNRLTDPKLASPGSWIFNYVQKKDGKPDVLAIHDTILQIRLEKAFPAFIGLLTMTYAAVVPEEAIRASGNEFRRNPVGTGPFAFKYWNEGVKLVLRRNPDYFESTPDHQVPQLEAVAVSFLIDKQTAFMEFAKGSLDYMSGIDARYKDELLSRSGKLRSKYQKNIRLIRQPYMNTEYLGFFIGDSDKGQNFIKKLEVRKAINYSIDREKMLKYLRNNVGLPGHGGMIPFGMPGYDSMGVIGYRYDPAKARALINENQLNNIRLTITTTADYVDLIKFVQSQLNSVGFDAQIEVMPSATMREMRAKGQLDFFRASWVADYPDAENYLSLFFSRNKTPGGPNYTHYENKVFDSLYLKVLKETDSKKRFEIYRKMDSLMMQEAPVVVLYYDEVLRFVNNRISGMGSNPTNLLDLRKVKISLSE